MHRVQVLCTTSTLALGVNLPAHLVVLKGTSRYVGEAECARGEQAGYQEYTATEVRAACGCTVWVQLACLQCVKGPCRRFLRLHAPASYHARPRAMIAGAADGGARGAAAV